MLRARESGRIWIHDEVVWKKMQEQGTADFDVLAEGEDYESMHRMAKLTNHDMDKILFEDLKRGFK